MPVVLVIEDEAELRDVFRSILRRAGHEVLVASAAREGLAMYRQHRPDVVVTDLLLPDESGLNLVLELTRSADVAVVVVSGSDFVDNADVLSWAPALGACRTLRKPVRRVDLLAAVDEAYLRKHPRYRSNAS